jgi:hypothetical protein
MLLPALMVGLIARIVVSPYAGQADAFGVYCPQTRRSYLVPMEAIADCRLFATLRVEPTKNGQRLRTRSAEEFAIS